MNKKTAFVPNISCIYCGKSIKRELGEIEGVIKVLINLPLHEVYVSWKSPATWEEIAARLREIDYPVQERTN
ncbi:heavy metal transporter [candidate division WOR-3 bacterium]|uniref:Heavy metal transporter n=1 Tax=candidate division WOR-3 bacterium TaxID=2052148 RepID=A0A9D5KAS2_UNCW3|nr:heavy metal transporter [candidate division WOR-3 bacterium]MBD3365304.1 heavy metal transporter [candidate division WOR-3 bacterium]